MLPEQAFLTDPNYYELLELEPSATHTEVEASFQDASMSLNLKSEDLEVRVEAAEKMLQLTRAYETLSDPVMRARYDLQTLGRKDLPVQEKIDVLFKEGIRAWRRSETDLALRYLKEVAALYPHRPLYRVHLAIAYAEKKWINFTETELETALRLDPDYKFAKETIAKLLFKLPDRKQRWFQSRLNQQVALLTGGFVLLAVLIATGIPQGMVNRVAGNFFQEDGPSVQELEAQLPADMVESLKQKAPQGNFKAIPYFKSDYKPPGQSFDYTNLKARNKVFYPAQATVAITYEDGSVLTYRPPELKGWKKVGDLPVMITANNELIPSPSTLPLKTGSGEAVNMNAPDFPNAYFPEYGAAPAAAAPEKKPSTAQNPPVSSAPTAAPASTKPANTPARNAPDGGYNPYGR